MYLSTSARRSTLNAQPDPASAEAYVGVRRTAHLICRRQSCKQSCRENSVRSLCLPLQPTQGPSDGNITFEDASGAVVSRGPVQGVSVGHVGRAISFNAQGGTYGLGSGTHTGALLPPGPPDLQSPC